MTAKSSPKEKPKKIVRRITFGNQVTLPPHFMKKYNLHVGDHVEVFEEKDRVIIQLSHSLIEKDKQRLLKKVTSFFKNQNDFSDHNEEDILTIIDSEREATRHKK